MKKEYRKIIRNDRTHQIFKMRKVQEKKWWDDKVWVYYEYQCPACKQWHQDHGTKTMGLILHITMIGKAEAVAKLLGEVKKIPHFDFWKENTRRRNSIYKPRQWKFY